jgi:hypothetical protein
VLDAEPVVVKLAICAARYARVEKVEMTDSETTGTKPLW